MCVGEGEECKKLKCESTNKLGNTEREERFGVGEKRLIVDNFVVVEQGKALLDLPPVAMGTPTVVPQSILDTNQPFPYSTTTNDKENNMARKLPVTPHPHHSYAAPYYRHH